MDTKSKSIIQNLSSTDSIEEKRGRKKSVFVAEPVSTQMGLPGIQEDEVEVTRPWPDVSMYGLHFGVATLSGGEQRMVMIDDDGVWANHAKDWGFVPSKWVGLWVKKSHGNVFNVKIPQFRKLFPDAKILELTDKEIKDRLSTLVVSRQSRRLSQAIDSMTMGANRMSWHPSKKIVEAPSIPLNISALSALHQTKYLGLNYLGHSVYELGDGNRITKHNDHIIEKEDDENPSESASFLRASQQNRSESLIQCAAGLVRELQEGKVLHANDFERYLEAIFGAEEISENNKLADEFSISLDAALINVLSESKSNNPHHNFLDALKLHEGRPSYFRSHGTLPTPLPISICMQLLASTNKNFHNPKVLDINSNSHSFSSHAWTMDNVEIVNQNSIRNHDITLSGVFSYEVAQINVDGLNVSRSDHKAVLDSLRSRSPSGTSIFLIAGSKNPGSLDSDFKRLMAYVGANYQIKGLCDIDPKMISPGNAIPSRLFIVGERMEHQDLSFSVPLLVPTIYDYESLWSWTEQTCGKILNNVSEFGFVDQDDRKENRWQAPYIPSSQVSEPIAMSPRNLLGPVRRALAKVAETTGSSTDDYVASKLHWTLEELSSALDSEQIDAIALAIFAHENNHGLIEADQTGLGKGRVLAAFMRYMRLNNPQAPILFLTKTSDLFIDIYRDIQDINSLDLFRDPIIINNKIVLRDYKNQEIGRSLKTSQLTELLSKPDCPPGFILSTYSQFNRKQPTIGLNVHLESMQAQKMISQGANRIEVLNYLASGSNLILGELSLDDPRLATSKKSSKSIISFLKNILSALKADELKISPNVELHRQLNALEMSDSEFISILKKAQMDNIELKQHWIASGALSNAILISDESHIAAGPKSQTNVNISEAIGNVKNAIYSSATFAKGVDNYAVYKKAFPKEVDPYEISIALSKGGPILQEILSAMLAEDGRMIRREHDLSNLDFKFSVDHDRLNRNKIWANSLADVLAAMSIVSGEIEDHVNEITEESLEKLKSSISNATTESQKIKLKSGIQYSNFSSNFYNLNRAFMQVINADAAADYAINSLREGRKPVITTENTNESILHQILLKTILIDSPEEVDFENSDDATANMLSGVNDSFDIFNSNSDLLNDSKFENSDANSKIDLGKTIAFKDLLEKYLENIFYGWQWKLETPKGGGKPIKVKSRLSFKKPSMESAETEIRKLIDAMPNIPISPLDLVKDRIRKAGYSVGEISGRTIFLSENQDGTHSICKLKNKSKTEVQNDFNSGRIDAIILSKSGSTGISLHASETFEDQSQRELIELQPAADIVERLQFWGRVKRKGEVCPPIIRMLSAGLPGELRLQTMQNAHLRKLSANISGNADNSGLVEDAPDILNSIGNEVCYRWLENNPKEARMMGMALEDMTERMRFRADGSISFSNTRFVDMLTLRILVLHTDKQELFNKTIAAEFKALIDQYTLEGTNPLKADSFDFRSDRGQSIVFEVMPGVTDSVFNKPVLASEIIFQKKAKGIKSTLMLEVCEQSRLRLEDRFGSASWHTVVLESANKAARKLMPEMLSKKYLSVENAIADSGTNAVKNLSEKVDFLNQALPRLYPGSVFKLSTSDVTNDVYVVKDLYIPQESLANLSEYKVVAVALSDHNTKTYSFSSLLHSGDAFFPVYDFDDLKSVMPIIKSYEEDINAKDVRIVLENNLFAASKIAASRGIGRPITYTDSKGVWQHGIMLGSGKTLRDVSQLDLDVSTPELMYEFLTKNDSSPDQNEYLDVVNSYKRDASLNSKNLFTISRFKNDTRITLHMSDDAAKWLTERKEVLPMLKSSWSNLRGRRSAELKNEYLKDFCILFLKLAKEAKYPVIINSKYRPWWNDLLLEKKRLNLNAQNIIDVSSPLDDIDSKLNNLLS